LYIDVIYFIDKLSKNTQNNECHENPSSGSRVVAWMWTDGQTDRYDDADSRFLKF